MKKYESFNKFNRDVSNKTTGHIFLDLAYEIFISKIKREYKGTELI